MRGCVWQGVQARAAENVVFIQLEKFVSIIISVMVPPELNFCFWALFLVHNYSIQNLLISSLFNFYLIFYPSYRTFFLLSFSVFSIFPPLTFI